MHAQRSTGKGAAQAIVLCVVFLLLLTWAQPPWWR
jgi:hypothetical protein